MKKIILAIDCRMINMSGIGTYLKHILPGIIQSGQFDVICLGYKDLQSFSWFSHVRYIELRYNILSAAEQWELFIKVPSCDIFWSPNWNVPLLPIRAKRRVVTIHDVYHLANSSEFSTAKIQIVRVYMSFIRLFVRQVITVSAFSRSEIVKYAGIPARKIAVIPLSVDKAFDQFVPVAIPENNYVLYVGNVKPHKNLKICLEAFDALNEPGLKFVIVGKREGFITGDESLEENVKHLGDRVIFTGHVSDDLLKSYYKNAKLFLFPSKYEGFGLPVLEAMKFGLPILASKSASIPEVGGDKIMYFDAYDREDLVKQLRLFLAGELNSKQDAYALHLKQFDWDITISHHIEVLKRTLI
jgi:glycosyltransferase involved in cell wall biosynthesis